MNESLFIVSREQLLRRICVEYLEMPGLQLTRPQAQRQWGLDDHTCAPAYGSFGASTTNDGRF